MKKLAFILLLLAVAGYSLGRGAGADPPPTRSDIELLAQAFATTGATAGGAVFYAWAVLSPDHYSPVQAEAAVEAMAAVFELNRGEYSVHLRSTGHYGYATMDYDLSDSTSIRLQVLSLAEETIANIEVRKTNQRGLSALHRQICQALLALGVAAEDVKISSCLEGYLDARLKDSDKLNIVFSAFKAVDATYQEGVEANGVSIWNGWSPLFTQSVSTGRGDVNFGIAFRPEGSGRRTFVRIATPVLPGSY